MPSHQFFAHIIQPNLNLSLGRFISHRSGRNWFHQTSHTGRNHGFELSPLGCHHHRMTLGAPFRPSSIHTQSSNWTSSISLPSPICRSCFRLRLYRIRAAHSLANSPYLGSQTIRNKLFNWLLISVGGTGLLYLIFSGERPVQLAGNYPSAHCPAQPLETDKSACNKKASSTRLKYWNLIKRNLIEPLATTSRFVYLLALFLPVLVTAPILLLEYVELAHPRKRRRRGQNGKLVAERSSTIWWYKLLINSMQMAGPTFIKLAQWAGSRTDLFPATLCEYFGRLHSNGKPHSMRYTRSVLEKAFGKKFEDIFISFNPEPLGIGAVAQVYKATLKPDLLPPSYLEPKRSSEDDELLVSRLSRKLATAELESPNIKPSPTVAIKVLHPRVIKNIKRDLKIMAFFARLINSFPGAEWISLPEEVEVFGQLMKSQVDLRVEADNLDRFEHNFTHRKTVSFPRPLKSYTTEKVLVEEFEDALPLKCFLRDSTGPYHHRLSSIGLDAFLRMLLIDNFTHADLHPGNIMVKFYKPTTKSILQSIWRKLTGVPDNDAGDQDSQRTIEIVHRLRNVSHDPSAWSSELNKLDQEGFQPELIFIDSGLVNELSQKNRTNFLELFEAIACFDGYRAGKLMMEKCRTPELVEDEETFALKIQHLALKVKSETFSLAKIKVSDVLVNVLTAVRDHHVKLEADFVNTILSILILEGIGRQLNPELDLFQSALPILRSLGSQQINAGGQLDFSGSRFGSMLKIWLLLEARHFASIAVSEVDDMLKYDFLAPNI